MPRRRRILVVDDDRTLRSVVCDALVDEGFDARTASNGIEALAILDGWLPDLIVLDLMMPVMDGWSFRRAQLDRPDIEQIPVFVLSATRDAAAEAEQLRALAAFAKPFDLDELINQVNRAFRADADEPTQADLPPGTR